MTKVSTSSKGNTFRSRRSYNFFSFLSEHALGLINQGGTEYGNHSLFVMFVRASFLYGFIQLKRVNTPSLCGASIF